MPYNAFRASFLLIPLLAGALAAGEAPVPVPVAPAPAPAAPPARTAQPSADELKAAIAALHKEYADRYARRGDHAKSSLARMLLHEAGQGGGAAQRAAQLREAIRLAAEADDGPTVLAAIDQFAAACDGVVIADERRSALQHLKHKAYVAALLTLLDAPGDARAAGIAGRWLGAVAGRWPEALELLAKASADAPAQAAAKLETGPPAGAPLPVAQAWIDLARKAPAGPERIGLLTHAELLLEHALPTLDAAEATRAHASLDAILPQIPLDPALISWSTLTAADWERIAAPVYPLTARVDRSDSGLVLEPGESVRVVPHPTETWNFMVNVSENVATTWKGVEKTVLLEITDSNNNVTRVNYRLGTQGFPYGSVLMWFDVNKKKQVGVVNGPGRLWFGPSTDRTAEGKTTGTIRLKLVRTATD